MGRRVGERDGDRRASPHLALDGELAAVFPGYENSLQARMYRDRLEGSVTLIKDRSKEQVIPFHARLRDQSAVAYLS